MRVDIAHLRHWVGRPQTSSSGVAPPHLPRGPLIATALLDLLRREMPDAQTKAFALKAMKPIFDDATFTLCGAREGTQVGLWARAPEGHPTMEAGAAPA